MKENKIVQATEKDGILILKEDGNLEIIIPEFGPDDDMPLNVRLITGIVSSIASDVNFVKYILEVGDSILSKESYSAYDKKEIIELIEEARKNETVEATLKALIDLMSGWKEYQVLEFVRGE